jgi:hypothetical protein
MKKRKKEKKENLIFLRGHLQLQAPKPTHNRRGGKYITSINKQ